MSKQWKVEDLILVTDYKKGDGRSDEINDSNGASGGHGRGSSAPIAVREVEPTLDDLPLADSANVYQLSTIADGVYFKVQESNYSLPAMAVNTGKLMFELRQLLDNSDMIAMQRNQLSGRLTRNWASVARGSNSVFQRRHLEEGIDSAVLIAVDQSSSMGHKMQHAADAVRLLCEALRRCVGTSFAARGFSDASMMNPDGSGTLYGERAQWYEYKGWADSLNTFTRRAASCLYSTMGGTPEVAALADCLKELSRRGETRKLLIWIGDGAGYSNTAMIALQKKYPDVTVIAFGIGVDLSPFFKHNVKVKNVAELSKTSLKKVVSVVKEIKAA